MKVKPFCHQFAAFQETRENWLGYIREHRHNLARFQLLHHVQGCDVFPVPLSIRAFLGRSGILARWFAVEVDGPTTAAEDAAEPGYCSCKLFATHLHLLSRHVAPRHSLPSTAQNRGYQGLRSWGPPHTRLMFYSCNGWRRHKERPSVSLGLCPHYRDECIDYPPANNAYWS